MACVARLKMIPQSVIVIIMSKRLTQPMRQVLQALSSGQQPTTKTGAMQWDSSGTVLSALRKRGLVTMRPDTSYEITPIGRDVLEQANRSVN